MMANDVVCDLELLGRHLHGWELTVRVHMCVCVYLCMCTHMHQCHGMYVEVRGQPAGISSFLPPPESWALVAIAFNPQGYPYVPESLFKDGHALATCSISGSSFSCLSQDLEVRKPWQWISHLLLAMCVSLEAASPPSASVSSSVSRKLSHQGLGWPYSVEMNTLPVSVAAVADSVVQMLEKGMWCVPMILHWGS